MHLIFIGTIGFLTFYFSNDLAFSDRLKDTFDVLFWVFLFFASFIALTVYSFVGMYFMNTNHIVDKDVRKKVEEIKLDAIVNINKMTEESFAKHILRHIGIKTKQGLLTVLLVVSLSYPVYMTLLSWIISENIQYGNDLISTGIEFQFYLFLISLVLFTSIKTSRRKYYEQLAK